MTGFKKKDLPYVASVIGLFLYLFFFFFDNRYQYGSFLGDEHVRFLNFFNVGAGSYKWDPYVGGSSIYPPFQHIVGLFFSLISGSVSTSAEVAREIFSGKLALLIFWVASIAPLVLFIFFHIKKNRGQGNLAVLAYTASLCFSLPYIYLINSADYSLLALPFLFVCIINYETSPEMSALLLGIASALCVWPVLFALLFVTDKKSKGFLIVIGTFLLLSLYPLAVFKGGFVSNLSALFENMRSYIFDYTTVCRGGITGIVFSAFTFTGIPPRDFQFSGLLMVFCAAVSALLAILSYALLSKEKALHRRIFLISLLTTLILPDSQLFYICLFIFPIVLLGNMDELSGDDALCLIISSGLLFPKFFLTADVAAILNAAIALCAFVYLSFAHLHILRRAHEFVLDCFARLQRLSFVSGLLFTTFICGFYAFTLYDRMMPIAEGWYSYFAKQISSGMRPYIDFEYLYTPVYMYIITLFTKIFGYDVIMLRILGVILFAAIGFLAYLIFTRVFDPVSSFIAATASVLFMQSEIVQIFYDYIRFMDLFVYISAFLLLDYLKHIDKTRPLKHMWKVLIGGIFTGLAFLTKQNSGGILAVYYAVMFVFLIIALPEKKKMLTSLVVYLASALLPVSVTAFVMAANGSLQAFLYKTISGAVAAKGGGATILFRWIKEAIPIFYYNRTPIFLILIFLSVNIYLAYVHKKKADNYVNPIYMVFYFLVLASGLFLAFKSSTLAIIFDKAVLGNTSYIIFLVAVLLFVASAVAILSFRQLSEKGIIDRVFLITGMDRPLLLAYMGLGGIVFALGYGVGTSGGLAESQVALGIGFVAGTLFLFASHKFKGVSRVMVVALCLIVCLSAGGRKYVHTYSWWGLSEPPIWELTETADVPVLRGIRMSENSREIYENIYEKVLQYTQPDDPIFSFPHNPIFYIMTERDPETFSYVQWFDVASDAVVLQDIETLIDSPPAAIVFCEVPEFVVNSHDSAFRKGENISGLHQMQDFLKTFVVRNKYHMVYTNTIPDGYRISLYMSPDKIPKKVARAIPYDILSKQ